MSIRGDVKRRSAIRRWLGHLVLLVFVCRALIPTGYMPDFSGVSEGLKVVICSVHGIQIVELDAKGQKTPANPDASHQQPCAFSNAATLAVLDVPQVDVTLRSIAIDTDFTNSFEGVPPVRAGPALGSRAPPQFS